MIAWTVLDATAWVRHWDPYSFILMNLLLPLQAAYTAPVIVMSQNRQVARDRLEAHNDYLINQKAEKEIRLWELPWWAHWRPELVRVCRRATPTSWGIRILTTGNPKDPPLLLNVLWSGFAAL